MQMAAGSVGAVQIIRNHADFLAFADVTSVQDAVGIHSHWIHMHVAKAYVLVAGVDLQRCRLLCQRANYYAIADRDDGPLVRLAAINAFIARRTRCGADILPLVPKTAGALSHPKTAGFAKIILPRITCFSASRPVQR